VDTAERPWRRLSRSDEIALTRRIECGDLKAKETMIESNLGLVRAVARTFRGSAVPFADLVQEGTIGLVRAVELFDHRRGTKFSTYAVWWIRRSMGDAIAGSNVIRVPSKANQQLAAVRRAEAQLERLGRRRASDAGIAEVTHLTATTVRSLRTAPQVVASLDEPVGEGTARLGDLIADLGVGEERSRQIERESLHRLRALMPAIQLAKSAIGTSAPSASSKAASFLSISTPIADTRGSWKLPKSALG
jgi:RNA polymerase primary sigma factor